MKRNIICSLIVTLWFVVRINAQAQGTVYLSNLSAASTGSVSVASNSWLAIQFRTGSNSAGYLLDSVQLTMLDATGNPSSFNVSLYKNNSFAFNPTSSLSPLAGPTDPQSADLYAYVPSQNLTLLPNTFYWIVVSAGTEIADGAYQWSTADTAPDNMGTDWRESGTDTSSNGFSWNQTVYYPQFSLNATPVPEPSTLSLLAIIGLPAFLFGRRYAWKH